MKWDKNIQSAELLHQDNSLQVLRILNKGSIGLSKRDFYEKKLAFSLDQAEYFYFSSLPLDCCPPDKDTVRAEIHLGFHRFTEVKK
jgi:hypothetical protein